MRTSSMLFVTAFLSCCGATAQTVWNVSPPGASLLAAVAAAQHGDTIVLASGFYDVGTGLVTDKALTIVGQPGTRIYGIGGGPALRVHSLPANRTFSMRGVSVELGGYAYSNAFLFENDAGHVYLSRCSFVQHCSAYSCAQLLAIQNCRLVTFADCTVQNVTLELSHSRVHASGCTFRGNDARMHPVSLGRAATSAVWVQGATAVLSLVRCSAAGGAGDGTYNGVEAVVVRSGTVTISGDANDVYAAGAPGSASVSSSPAIWNDLGILLVDPRITAIPNPGQPVVVGTHAVAPRPFGVATQTAAIGGAASATVLGDAGEPVVLFMGLPDEATAVSPFGNAWVQPATAITLAVSVMGPSEHWVHSIAIPNQPFLRSLALTTQAVGGGIVTPIRLAMPSTIVIE